MEGEKLEISTVTSVNAISSNAGNLADLSGIKFAGERVYPTSIENGIDEH